MSENPLRRYAFLSGFSARTSEEELEVHALREQFRLEGCDPGWAIVPRKDDVTEAEIARIFGIPGEANLLAARDGSG